MPIERPYTVDDLRSLGIEGMQFGSWRSPLRSCLNSGLVGLRRDELEHVFTEALEPLLAGNLNVPAGEWQGFDIDWIEA